MESHFNVQKFLRNSAIVVVGIFLAYAVLILWLTWPVTTFSIDKAGTFGDSFGIVTSLFTGLGFAGLLTTIFLQREDLKLGRIELQETRDEIRLQSETFYRQRFEDAFYRILSLYRENLKEVAVRKDSELRLYGIEALAHLTTKFEQEWASKGMIFPRDAENQKKYITLLGLTIQTVLVRHARYLETLSCILTLIDEECIPKERKPLYWKILSSQLTAHEIKYLFYQSLIIADFAPLREMISNSKDLQYRLSTMSIQHGHRKAFECVWKIEIPKTRSPYAPAFSRAESKSLRVEMRKLRKERRKSADIASEGGSSQAEERNAV